MSGAIVAMEEDYDVLGVYFLALVTAFGGGATRNLLIGVPISALWDQGSLFVYALIVATIIFLLPNLWFHFIKSWTLFDAMGLAAFAIQGALYAIDMGHPISAVITAALLTGSGGGLIRDLLAGRKPIIFRDVIYALWAMFGGLMIGLGWPASGWPLFTLLGLIVLLRMVSVYFQWRLPKRKLSRSKQLKKP